jgi:hypothetical protein
MSRSKNKIAVTTLLSALACSATASAAGQNGKDIKSVESQTSFSTRKSSESSIKSARSLEGARSWFQKIPTWAKITALVSAPILTAEIYNEIAGAVSGKKWYSGKYSFVNLARGKGEDENPEPNGTVENSENQDEADSNIYDKSKDKTENKIYTNSGNTVIIDEKYNTGLGAAPSGLTEEQNKQLNIVLKQFKEADKESSGLYEKFEAKLKDGLIRIIKGKFKIVAYEGGKSYAEKFINFVKGENGDYEVRIFKSNDSFVIKVISNKLAKKFLVSIAGDKLQIGEEFILLN